MDLQSTQLSERCLHYHVHMSKCIWQNWEEPDTNGNRRVYCINCGYITRTSMAWEFSKIYRPCSGSPSETPAEPSAVSEGPGTELKKIFDSIGIKQKSGCPCPARMAEMNRRGIQGCIDTKPEILGWLQEAYDESTITERATAGLRAIAKGYPTTLEGLLDLAIDRARLSSA